MARENGPIVVCVINLKGGVGKSTISTLLARYAFRTLKKDVLAIDLDPQANMSQSLMGSGYNSFLSEKRPSIVEIFNGFRAATPNRKAPSAIEATDCFETIQELNNGNSLQLIPSRFDFSDNLTDAIRPDPKVLARFLANNVPDKDIIIIDCSPTESILTHAAYHASALVLVPVKPEFFATIGFPLLQQSLSTFRMANRGSSLTVAGVVINNGFYDGGNNGGPEKYQAMRDIREQAANNEWPIFDTEIPFSRGFPKLMRGNRSHSGNADYFYKFAVEFFKKISL